MSEKKSQNTNMDKAIDNISKMEAILQQATQALNAVEASVFNLQNMQDDIQKLSDYYGSKQWRKDFEADEQGLFPEDLKRGVLSEDGIYDLLERNKEVMGKLKMFFENCGGL